MLEHAPRFTPGDAARLARDLFDLDAVVSPLTSERDQNFLLDSGNNGRLVLKIANALESPELLDAQQQAIALLSRRTSLVPRVVPATTGKSLNEAQDADGRRHLVWAVTHLPGVPLASARYRSKQLLTDFGRRIGELSLELRAFDHPAIHRDLYWDLASGRRVVDELRGLVDDRELGRAIDSLIARFDEHVTPLLPQLRRGAIHNDLNDYNILVDANCGSEPEARHVTGIVDFGDMLHGYTVGDLAIAAAYIAIGAADSVVAVSSLVRGYHAVSPLAEPELDALFGLTCLRLCTSACVAAQQLRERPDNAYLGVSQEGIRRTLPALARIPFRLPTAIFRAACGLEPFRTSARVRARLGSGASRPETNILGPEFPLDRCTVLDLSVASPLVSCDEGENSEPSLTARIDDAVRTSGAAVAIGRYDERRLLYTAPFFASEEILGGERRTVHLGIDLFAPAGTPVHAPIEGVVHAFADNAVPQDYGPVIILRHSTDDGVEFYTLYGHLSRESLTGLRAGQRVARGQRFASLGDPTVNVQWTPHLHFQIISDLLELGTDFPGVAAPSQREVWRSASPDPNLILGTSNVQPERSSSAATRLAARRERLGSNLSLAYREPLTIVRGWRQYLFDDEGRRYLDAYNNVPHVGHSHPRVVSAGARQMAVLNTNTRYLHDLVNEYAARLAATLPSPLNVCYFLNSASEANELALRLARAFTGRRDMVVLEGAYHGHTTSLIDISPYKHAGPGGAGAPDWVHAVPVADDYRGAFRRGDPGAGEGFARLVEDCLTSLRERGRAPAGFVAETCPSVGGQIIFPPHYLEHVYRHVRAAGGLCIADEVQTGLGRMGTHFWAFEAQSVVPDIVVMGKPLGNGHPIGAVVTTGEIARAFDNGMEFFSTFGGNTVSCAVGLAVLDVLRDERLQEHALRVGAQMLAALGKLRERYPLVGDVRGSGLFLGVELVRDRETLDPAGSEASFVSNRMREHGILIGTDGPYHNVLKIRPPMPFDDVDAERLVGTLEGILRDDLGN
jgi:4-aminobutyrate aminotransferase-like enzyme/Ser/Thr protein kinase RdoA (MazF antagonist)